MKVTFLYKRRILGLHYSDGKNTDNITVKQQITLQIILYIYRNRLDF